MCIAPIYLPNPYRDRGLAYAHKGKKVKLRIGGRFDYIHDTLSAFIQVPCGQCSQCLSIRQGFVNQRIQMESLRSEMFYFTLTYANRALKYTNISNYKLRYPYYVDIQNLFRQLRKNFPHPLRYFVISEYGGKKRRPHFHGIISVTRDDIKNYYRGSILYCEKVLFRDVLKYWRRNISSSRKNPVYMDLCDFVYSRGRSTYDLHWVQPIRNHDNDLSFYLSKYLFKSQEWLQKLLTKIKLDPSLSDVDTKTLISQLKPRSVMSKDFGSYKLSSVESYIKSCLSKVSDYPTFFDINTGKSMLLAPYYRKRFVTIDMKFDLYWKYLHDVQYLDIDCSHLSESYNPELLINEVITDMNRKAFKSIRMDKHLRRVKNIVAKY